MPNLEFWFRVIIFSIFWMLLTGWEPSSWGIGAVCIIMASLLSIYLRGQQQTVQKRINPAKVLSFSYYFFIQSMRGGLEVAQLALIPNSNFSPGMVTYQTDLTNESQIFALMQLLSILPGTVSTKRKGREITIHVLNLGSFSKTEIDDCQKRVSELLGSRSRTLGGK
jgi:multicomponent Na+:H+ antiporter subunit E